MKEETAILSIYNPFTDKHEDLVCSLELHFDKKSKLLDASLSSIVSEEGVNLMEWLKPERTESIENDFVEAYDG